MRYLKDCRISRHYDMFFAESLSPAFFFSLTVFPSDILSLFINSVLDSIQLLKIILDSREYVSKVSLSHPQP